MFWMCLFHNISGLCPGDAWSSSPLEAWVSRVALTPRRLCVNNNWCPNPAFAWSKCRRKPA